MSLWTWHPSPCWGDPRPPQQQVWYKWERALDASEACSCEYDNRAFAAWMGLPVAGDGLRHSYARVTGRYLRAFAAGSYECGPWGPVESQRYQQHAFLGDPGNWYDLQHFRSGLAWQRYYPTVGTLTFSPWPGGPHPY